MTSPHAGAGPRIALVTGAARGQGRANCLRLAADGADIAAVDICAAVGDTVPYPPATRADLTTTERAVRAAGRRALAWVADVRDAAAMDAVAADVAGALGVPDIVVANAGVVAPAPAATLGPESWATVVDTDLTGVWHTVAAVLPGMLDRARAGRPGSIVITGSANGGIKAPPHLAHYAAAKFGVAGLVRSLAAELGPYGIRVNAVAPTAVSTTMIHNAATYRLFAPDVLNPGADDVAPAFAAFHSLPVPWIEPEDVANAVGWLAGDEARYVTGVVLPVDAGLSAR